jgi:hypothetical protein
MGQQTEGGEELDQVSGESQVEGQKNMGVKAASMRPI